MRDTLDRLWRIVATGFCFSVFGLGGLFLRVAVFPCVRWAVRDPERRAVRVKAIIRGTFRVFVGLMVRTGVLSLEVHGLDKLHRSGGRLVVANHPSLVDVVFLMSFIDRADCIVKGALARNPFTRGPVASAGFLCNDEGEGLVDDCVASVRRGNRLIIFPEGSRTPLSGALPLQRGAARIAVQGGIDITPVRIRCQPRMLAKGVPWYRVPPRRGHFVIEVCDDIPIAPFLEARSHAIATRQLTDHLTDYFFPLETRRAAT
jgi:1-acyl-sn-glycerol-3-phosphate acyltransferase